MRFRRKERGTRVKDREKVAQAREPLFHFLALVSFLARSKPKVFLGISLLRNQTETLATQAKSPGIFAPYETQALGGKCLQVPGSRVREIEKARTRK